MPLGSAHRLVPEATFIEPDPEADRAAAEAAFEALGRSSPSIAGSADPTDAAFGQFELGIDGLGPLWGPEPALIERASSALRAALGDGPAPGGGLASEGDLTPRAGIAGTHFAATIAAVHARPDAPIIVPPDTEPAFLSDYPSVLLTTDPDARARLTRFGLRRIGAVADLPRSALIARFGGEGARLHARANGEETEPFRARQASERLAFALPIEPPVEDLEPLRFVLHRLVTAITAQLTGRGLAADRVVLTLELDLAFALAGTPSRLVVEQRFPEPTADPEAIERLLFARLEREPPPAAVARLDLELRGTIPAAGQQLPLFVPQAARTARLGWQLARLALTYGADRVRRVVVTDPEAALPEDRWSWQSVDLDGTSAAAGTSVAAGTPVATGKARRSASPGRSQRR
jgi:protein ImuB